LALLEGVFCWLDFSPELLCFRAGLLKRNEAIQGKRNEAAKIFFAEQ
jgi:hypothetical protein